MNHRIKALALGVALACMSAPAANASSVIGSIEPTQIANNVELVAQYVKQVEQAATQIKQYQAQLKALQQMDPNKLKSMLKGMGGATGEAELLRRLGITQQLDTELQDLSKNMQTIYREGKVAADVVALLNSRGSKVTGRDYIAMMKALAEQRQDTYGARMRAITKATEDARSDIQRVNNIAAAAGEITSDVQGLQAIVQTNGIMAQQLAGLQTTLAQTAAMNTDAAQALAAEADRKRIQEKQSEDWMRNNMLPAKGGSQ